MVRTFRQRCGGDARRLFLAYLKAPEARRFIATFGYGAD